MMRLLHDFDCWIQSRKSSPERQDRPKSPFYSTDVFKTSLLNFMLAKKKVMGHIFF